MCPFGMRETSGHIGSTPQLYIDFQEVQVGSSHLSLSIVVQGALLLA